MYAIILIIPFFQVYRILLIGVHLPDCYYNCLYFFPGFGAKLPPNGKVCIFSLIKYQLELLLTFIDFYLFVKKAFTSISIEWKSIESIL